MGASGWIQVVRHQPDIEAALQEAKRKVFESDGIYDCFGILSDPAGAIARLREQYEEIEFPPDFPEEDAREIRQSAKAESEGMIAEIERFMAATETDEKIDALRRAVGFEGTHTIIDIPSIESVTRVEEEELVQRYGTERPSLEIVRQTADELMSLVGRFEAAWLVAEDEQGDSWICFVGVSGD